MKLQRTSIVLITVIVITTIASNSYNFLFPFSGCTNTSSDKHTGKEKISGKISISGAFALYPLTVKWAEEFEKVYPDIQIDISAGGAGKGMTDVLSGMVDLAMFSREVTPVETGKGAWNLTVAKDAVFATVNTSNPEYETIMNMGLTREQFQRIFQQKVPSWGQLLNNKSQTKLNVYTRSDACGAAATWAKYVGLKQEDLHGTGLFGDPGMADAVKKDKLGVGYNNLVYLYDLKTNKSVHGLSVIPIDLNGNRVIDPEEDFYNTLDEVMKAIQSGKYPSPPARDLYLISKGEPTIPAVRAFLAYILNEGQSYITRSGYVQLDSLVIASEKLKLIP